MRKTEQTVKKLDGDGPRSYVHKKFHEQMLEKVVAEETDACADICAEAATAAIHRTHDTKLNKKTRDAYMVMWSMASTLAATIRRRKEKK